LDSWNILIKNISAITVIAMVDIHIKTNLKCANGILNN